VFDRSINPIRSHGSDPILDINAIAHSIHQQLYPTVQTTPMPSYAQVAESYISNVLLSVQPRLQQSVKQAILGGDEDLLRLLFQLPNSPVRLFSLTSQLGSA
jgi:hypothetical protein